MPNKPFFAPPAKGQSQLTGPLDIPIVHTLYQIYASWSALLNKFPKTERYTLGQTIAGELLTCLELIITAASTPSAPIKIENLRQASAKLTIGEELIVTVRQRPLLDLADGDVRDDDHHEDDQRDPQDQAETQRR